MFGRPENLGIEDMNPVGSSTALGNPGRLVQA